MIIVPRNSLVYIALFCFIISKESCKTEARPKEVIPAPGWFNGVEGFVVSLSKAKPQNLKKFEAVDSNKILAGSVETVKDDHVKKRRKKKKKMTKKTHNRTQNRKELKNSNGVVKKKKKVPKRKKLKFIKSTLNDKDSSVLSSSKEEVERKPVDIIVHIKMND